jgi:hypothetical protein
LTRPHRSSPSLWENTEHGYERYVNNLPGANFQDLIYAIEISTKSKALDVLLLSQFRKYNSAKAYLVLVIRTISGSAR